MKTLIIVFSFVCLFVFPQLVSAQTFHINVNHQKCTDSVAGGSETTPYCTVLYATTIAKPGNTFIIHKGRYGHTTSNATPAKFTKSGTATQPITWRAEDGVVLGGFIDVNDRQFVATTMPNVYSIADPGGAQAFQTFFDPIVVDDPNNPSKYSMKDIDGPLVLSSAPNLASVAAHEGSQRRENGRLYIHPYTNRVPSETTTDFVIAKGSRPLQVESNVRYNVFENFHVTYSSGFAFQIMGSYNTIRNLTIQAVSWFVRGNHNYVDGVTSAHVIVRGETWQWHYSGTGSSMVVFGANTIKNVLLYHAWNAELVTESAQTGTVIDGVRTFGSPNHCGVKPAELDDNGGAIIIRNYVSYNCQDNGIYDDTVKGTVYEHIVGSGILIRKSDAIPQGITIRNSMIRGGINYGVYTGEVDVCTHEPDMILENNIIASTARIHHCSDKYDYPITDYIAKCQSHELTGCMQMKGNLIIDPSQWGTVIKDAANLGDVWDVHLVKNSPAIDMALPSGTTTDIDGRARPTGTRPDVGIYEYAATDCVVSDWGAWIDSSAYSACVNRTQSRTEQRTRSVLVQPENGGLACPTLTDMRTTSRACWLMTITCHSEQGKIVCDGVPQ